MIEEEKFFAWLDGELGGSEAAEMEARVASDPDLAARAERHRALQTRLTGAFDTIAAAPLPEKLRPAIANEPANVVDFDARRQQARRRLAWPGLPQWAAVAATLVLGIMIGTLVAGRGESPVQMRDGALYAAGDTGRALDAQLASAPSGDVRIGITFRDSAGEICRSFTGEATSGLACRDEGRWRLRGLFPTGEGQGSDYRMAAGMNPGLAALVDTTMAGEPMDAAEEARAKKRGWR